MEAIDRKYTREFLAGDTVSLPEFVAYPQHLPALGCHFSVAKRYNNYTLFAYADPMG
jgi:hypothetical protein